MKNFSRLIFKDNLRIISQCSSVNDTDEESFNDIINNHLAKFMERVYGTVDELPHVEEAIKDKFDEDYDVTDLFTWDTYFKCVIGLPKNETELLNLGLWDNKKFKYVKILLYSKIYYFNHKTKNMERSEANKYENKCVEGYYYDSNGDHSDYDPKIHINYTFKSRDELLKSIYTDLIKQDNSVDVANDFEELVKGRFETIKEEDIKGTMKAIYEEIEFHDDLYDYDVVFNLGHTKLENSDDTDDSDTDSSSESESESEEPESESSSESEPEDDEPPAKKLKK
jgi:hypothetical protein